MKTLRKIPTITWIVTLIATNPVTAQANAKIFGRIIKIPGHEVRIDSLVKIFSRQTTIEFSFNSRKISPSKKLVVPKQDKTLSQWLSILQNKMGIQYKLVGNHIILVDNSIKVSPKTTSIKPVKHQKSNAVKTVDKDPVQKIQAATTKEESPFIPQVTNKDTGEYNQRVNIAKTDKNVALFKDSVKQDETGKLKSNIDNVIITDQENYPERKDREESIDKTGSIQLAAGYSMHGSGDLKGIFFGTEYINFISRKFSLNYNFRASINHGKDELIVNNAVTGTSTDASIRYTTAGVQLGVNAGFSLVSSPAHEFIISIGGFGRYQSASNGSDGYSMYSPQVTGQPTVLIGYDNRTPQQTFALGGILQFQYNVTLTDKIYIGVNAGFQTDTNGDAIPQAGITIGRRFYR